MSREEMIEKLDIFCKNHKHCDDYPACPLYPCELDFCELQDSELKKAYNDVFVRKITIPADATNGDVLCMLFPNMHYTLSEKTPRVVTTIGIASTFDIDWWNAPYKEESEGAE